MEAKHSWLRTPFGDGYRISAQAYRTQLTAEGLRVLLPQGHAVKQSPVSSIATIREDGSFDLTAIAQKLCHDRLRRLVLWEVLAVFLQSLVVLSLGLVLQELEFGLPTWLSLLGEAAEHPAWRSVPFALLIVLARFLQQVAKHRRVKIVEQASSALCAFLFRRATTSGAAAACSVAELLNAVPRLVEATAKGSRLQLAAPMLGLSLGFGLLLMTLGAMAPLLLLLQLLLLGLEVLLRKLTPRWKQEAMHLREQREAMSAAALAMEMGCASATVKLFAWESAVWARLQQLRKREKAALQRLQRLEVLASVARELGVFVPVAVALLLQWLVFGMSLWACFQALAACRMTAQQLRRAQQVLLTKIPQVNACLEQELERTAPKQGDRSTYKSARYAVAIDSMRFFWEEPQEVQALPPKPNGNTALQTVMQKAEKGVSSGLDLVDSVSDDASVAERARRSTNTSNRFDLKVLSLQVKRGSHVALVGATGSGKSTLLAGLVGGCRCEHWGDDREGGVSLSGRLAYAPQRPCVKLADCSIRENVLCGRSFDAQRYEQALTTSTLAEDLQRLSNGDSALVEELAGPGLAAMQVARALFAEAQILLLDDPFVEMDHDRGKRAVSSLVKKYKDRTMILATQNLSLLSPLDSIIVLRNGTVFEQGDYKTLSSMPTELSRLLLISNQKESRRREGHGLPCPCICYEVGPDPMRELYPMDELFGTFPSFGHPSKAPKRWVSALQAVAVHRPSSRTVKAEAAPPSWERLNRRGSLDLMMDALRDVSDVDAGEPGVTDALLRAPRASSSSKAPQTAGEEVSGDGLQDLAKHHEAGRTPGIQSLPEDEDVYEDDKFGQLLQSMDDEGGPLDRVENKVHRRLPSASAVPMVGASEAGGYAGYTADSPGESIDQRSPTSPEVPSDQRIPRPNSSPSGHVNSDRMPLPDDTAQWAPGDDAVGTLAPGSPESADGLRRRVPLADLEEKRPPSHLRPEGQHGAPAPQTLGKPREEDTLKRRRADKEDPRTQRMDVLEKALKEKNDKIAELEKQVAKSGNIEKKELLRGSSSSSFLEGRFGHAPGRSSSRRGRGLSVLLLGRVGCSFWMLVLLVLVSTGIQLAVPVVLSYIFAPTWRMSTTAEPTISIPSPSIATEPTTETTSTTASETSGVAVPTFPSDVVVDDSEVVWRGFATSTAPASTTTTTTTTTTLASTEAEIEQDWSIKLQGHFCHEPNLAQETRPQGIYDLDPTIGWHWASTLSLQACKKACEDLIAWGCRFISWGGPVAPKRWCYVHQQCAEVMNVHFYQVFEMNMTDGSRRLQRHGDEAQDAQGGQGDGGSLPKIFSRPMVPVLPGPRRAFVTDETDLPAWLSTNSLEAALAGLCLFLPLLSVSQARLAADVGMQASQQNAEKQMKAVLSAAGDLGGASMFWAEGSLFPQAADMVPLRERPSLLKDVADADEFLPLPLARGLAAAAQVLAALLCAAAASGRQAVLAVSLTIVLGLSIYLHRMRLPFLHQIRRIASVTEDAAALRLKHLAECYEVLRVHGRLQTLSDDYEALCHDRALVATAADAAGRWLYTRLHCCVSLLVGLLCFSTLTQAPTALPSRMGLAVSIAALVQVAVLPDAVVELVKYGGLSTHGLAALRRMYQLVKETQSEELESPIFSVSRGELPTDRRGLGQPIHRARSGKVALGDLMVDNELPEDVIKSKKEQSFSVVGFPVEKVPADWPYFGAVEFEDVTVRYSTELSPSVSECSLRVPAGKALLVVGEESCGKSTLLRTLLRLAPETQEAGRVLVDGIDTRSVGLSTLRGRVAVVPQELVLYRGTWLQNLDPMEEFSEEEVQMVLRLTRFENWMLRHAPDGLHQTLEEGGAPHGAAAVLLGVSRAMLRLLQKRSKLLLMDATTCRLSASSDADLTALVLRYCRRAAVAVMQVSRRVQQAPLYDEVAVMALGRILEQGPAKKLWVKDGALRRMAKEQGLDSAKMTKADALSARLGSVWGWEVSPQESPAWQDEFTVGMKKVKAEKEKKDSR